jgi:murein DD-endopeptidase MepM/ murein hydrolase activator NlpD
MTLYLLPLVKSKRRFRMNAMRTKWKKCALIFPAQFLLTMFPATLKAQVSENCTGGLSLKLSAPESSQGTLLRVELGNSAALAEVKGEWAGKDVSFWQDEVHTNIRRSFLGVDLEQAPGTSKFVVTAKRENGESVSCSADVTIKAGHFVVEKLTVDEKFVQPNPEDQKRGEKEAQRLHEIYAERTPEKYWNGAFRFPVTGPRQGTNFGSRRILNGETRPPHGGLDIHASTGTPVHASQRGRVALAGELYYAGNTVLLDHGMGIYTFYCHLSKIDVKEGDVVDVGALIGLVGATGRVTGPHLHWGLEVNEARVNPLQILPPIPVRKKSGAAGKLPQ